MTLFHPGQKQLALFDLDGEAIDPTPVVRKPGMKKLQVMHGVFGVTLGEKCSDCADFLVNKHHDYTYFKCLKYGLTRGEGTDWRKGWEACGAFAKEKSNA